MARTPAKPLEGSACVDHTPMPSGYQAWHCEAERLGKTHRARRCAECGLWLIWELKPDPNPSSHNEPYDGTEKR